VKGSRSSGGGLSPQGRASGASPLTPSLEADSGVEPDDRRGGDARPRPAMPTRRLPVPGQQMVSGGRLGVYGEPWTRDRGR
jgi:hypothetical protein